MANLKALRVRIASITSTIKITSAMKMVAASKLKRLQEQKDLITPYREIFQKMVQAAYLQANPLEANLSWFTSPSSSKVAVVIFSANKGLCGPFNNSVIKHARKIITELKSQNLEPELFFVGKRAKDVLSGKFFAHYTKSTFENIHDFLSDAFLKGKYLRVEAVFNRYQSVVSQKATNLTILPLSLEKSPLPSPGILSIEPSAHDFLEKACQKYVEILIFEANMETFVGEQAARMVAMDSATRSAKQMLDHLKLEFNRTRQSLITKELVEVISGAEASV